MFFFLHSLKGSCFIHLVLQSGPKWPMTRCRTLCGEKEIHKTRWVGWTISSDHHNLSIDRHQKKQQQHFPQLLSILHWHGIHNMCVWFYQQQTSFQEMSEGFFFSWRTWNCLMRFAFQLLSICFTTKMHLYFGPVSPLWALSFHGSFQSMSA